MTIHYQIAQPKSAAGPTRACPTFTSLAEFKNIAVEATKLVAAGKLPSNCKWRARDLVTVLAYAWIRGVSVHHASEKLNAWAVEQGIHVPVQFADGRHSRAFPHQTTVNDWLAKLDKSLAEDLSRAVFEASVKTARKRGLLPRQVVLEYDLTYRGYWGRRRDALIKGSKMVKGTRYIRHYHGALIHGGGVSQFVALQHLAKGQSKIPFLLSTARWLRQLGFKVKWVVVDREYYRHGVLAGLKGLGYDVIVPAKNYSQLQTAKNSYLLGKKGRVQRFKIGTKAKKGAKTQYIACWLVLYARGKQNLGAIRAAFRKGTMTMTEASQQLYGLITTAAPQFHGKRFPRLIKRLYKMRWQVECGFRDEEVKHCPWRSDLDGERLVDELGRMVLYNAWQLARKEDFRGDKLTFQVFRDEYVDAVTSQLNL